jgi:hypothetical protein
MVTESLLIFVTLFLSLTRGVQPVELRVTGPVDRVELRLDGTLTAEIKGPPWKTDVDFGAAIKPHELVATAYDASGHRIGAISQVINVPRPRTELAVLIERGPARRPIRLRLAWKSAVPLALRRASVVVDGKPVVVGLDRTAELPRLDLSRTHMVHAEVEFSGGSMARKDIALGGEYMERSQTELTAVAVVLDEQAAGPGVSELEGAVLARGKPVCVVAIDQTPVTVVTVIGAEVRPRWTEVLRTYWASRNSNSQAGRLVGTDTLIEVEPVPRTVMNREQEIVTLFPSYVDSRFSRYALLNAIARYGYGGVLSAEHERFAEAVAVGGLDAAADNQRRAVIAVASLYDLASSHTLAAKIRDYLRTLGVPFLLWTPDRQVALRYTGPWGRAEYVSMADGRLVEAKVAVRKSLERQRIIWVAGTYLPQEIELARSDLGLALAR